MAFQSKVYLVTLPAIMAPMRPFTSLLKAALFIAKHERYLPGWKLYVGQPDDAAGLQEMTAQAEPMIAHLQHHIPTCGEEFISSEYRVTDDPDHKRFKHLRLERCRKVTTRT